MNDVERVRDRVANAIRINYDEADAILNGKKVIQRVYFGGKYLNVEISILDPNIQSQIV